MTALLRDWKARWALRAFLPSVLASCLPASAHAQARDHVTDYREALQLLATCEEGAGVDPLAMCVNQRLLVRVYESVPTVGAAGEAAIRGEFARGSPRAPRVWLSLIRNLHWRRRYREVRRESQRFETIAATDAPAAIATEIRLLDADARLAEGDARGVLATLEAGGPAGTEGPTVFRGLRWQLRGLADSALGRRPAAAEAFQQARALFSMTEGGRLYLPQVLAEQTGAAAPRNLDQAMVIMMELAQYIRNERARLGSHPSLPLLNLYYFRPALIRAFHHLQEWTDDAMRETLAGLFTNVACGRPLANLDEEQFQYLSDSDLYGLNLLKGRVARQQGRLPEARICLQWALHFANRVDGGRQVAPLVELIHLRLHERGSVLRSELNDLARAAHHYGDTTLSRADSAMITLHTLDWLINRNQPDKMDFAFRASTQILLGLTERGMLTANGLPQPSPIPATGADIVATAWHAAHVRR